MINYPTKKKITNTKVNNKANMGMALEEMIEISNNYYLNANIATINKVPTNVKVLKTVDNYHIIDGYFQESKFLDFVGAFKGKYLEFDAKETASHTSFPMSNIKRYQIERIRTVLSFGGISFLIIYFKARNEIFLVDGNLIIKAYDDNEKSIEYGKIKETSILIKEGYLVPVDYLKEVEKNYL